MAFPFQDPVERIVKLEGSLAAKKREMERSVLPPGAPRPPSPGIRFEEEEGLDVELLVPVGSHAVMVHNEHHTMSMLVVFLQLDSTSLERSVLLEVLNSILRFVIYYLELCARA